MIIKLRKIDSFNLKLPEILINSQDIIGDHTILYAGAGERIELKHQAHSRMCFASGAIRAIKFIAQAQEPKIYSTRDVLGL